MYILVPDLDIMGLTGLKSDTLENDDIYPCPISTMYNHYGVSQKVIRVRKVYLYLFYTFFKKR